MPERLLDNETRYQVMRLLAEDPSLSQRDLARALGVSVGRINYCLKALLERGYVKAANFKNSRNRRGYLYQLTPAGLSAKTRATRLFLARKVAEYERLEQEIQTLRRETESSVAVSQAGGDAADG